MKVLTIVKNDHVTGVEYGMVEIGETVTEHKYATNYTIAKNQFKKTQQRLRTKQK